MSDFNGTARPFVAGFMRGYRAWRMSHAIPNRRFGEGVLVAASHNEEWQPGRNTAECLTLRQVLHRMSKPLECSCIDCGGSQAERDELVRRLKAHRIPSTAPPCGTCGFYGMHSPDLKLAESYLSFQLGSESILQGSFKGTGNIVIGEKGLRTQYAEVEALAGSSVANIYGAHYGVPVFPTMEALVKEFPPDPTYATPEISSEILAPDPDVVTYISTVPATSPSVTAAWVAQRQRMWQPTSPVQAWWQQGPCQTNRVQPLSPAVKPDFTKYWAPEEE